jgi:hypothetical protein
MRILGTIVPTSPLFMASRQLQFGLCRTVGTQPVGHKHVGREALLLHEPPHQLHGSRLAALSLNQEIENLAFVIDRALKPELLACNDHGHLIEMPARGWTRASMRKSSCEQRPKLQDPSSHRLVGDIQPALSQHIFNVAIAEREPDIEPHGVPDDLGRELMARK